MTATHQTPTRTLNQPLPNRLTALATQQTLINNTRSSRTYLIIHPDRSSGTSQYLHLTPPHQRTTNIIIKPQHNPPTLWGLTIIWKWGSLPDGRITNTNNKTNNTTRTTINTRHITQIKHWHCKQYSEPIPTPQQQQQHLDTTAPGSTALTDSHYKHYYPPTTTGINHPTQTPFTHSLINTTAHTINTTTITTEHDHTIILNYNQHSLTSNLQLPTTNHRLSQPNPMTNKCSIESTSTVSF